MGKIHKVPAALYCIQKGSKSLFFKQSLGELVTLEDTNLTQSGRLGKNIQRFIVNRIMVSGLNSDGADFSVNLYVRNALVASTTNAMVASTMRGEPLFTLHSTVTISQSDDFYAAVVGSPKLSPKSKIGVHLQGTMFMEDSNG